MENWKLISLNPINHLQIGDFHGFSISIDGAHTSFRSPYLGTMPCWSSWKLPGETRWKCIFHYRSLSKKSKKSHHSNSPWHSFNNHLPLLPNFFQDSFDFMAFQDVLRAKPLGRIPSPKPCLSYTQLVSVVGETEKPKGWKSKKQEKYQVIYGHASWNNGNPGT